MSEQLPETQPAARAPAQSTPTGAMLRTLGLVSAICGLAIVSAYQGTLSAVKANKIIAQERAVFKVLPGAKSVDAYMIGSDGSIEVAREDAPNGVLRFFAAYDETGRLQGVAAEGAATGYADVVRVMFGYLPDCECIVGFDQVSSRETPGIGDKITVDKDFRANFKSLEAKLNADKSALANDIKVVKHGSKTSPWQIDAIAGATITSRAVGKGINDTARALLPKLVPQLEKIRSKR